MIKTIEIPPIESYDSLDEEVKKLEDVSEIAGPSFTFEYKPNNSQVSFKVGDKCRVTGKTESGGLKWDDNYVIENFYVDRNDRRKLLLIEIKTKKPSGFFELTKLPRQNFLNFVFSTLGDNPDWTVAREYN